MPSSAADRSPTVWDIRRSGLAQFDALITKPNVRYMTVGHKVKDGVRRNEKSLNIYVTHKQDVAEGESIPKRLGIVSTSGAVAATMLTDVTEIGGEPAVFGIRSGHLIKAFDKDLGVCAISYARGGRKFMLTNAHVAVDVARGGRAGPVSVLNRVDGKYYQFGKVVNASRLNAGAIATHDVALIEIDPAFQVDEFMILDMDNDIDRLEGIDTLAPHQYWYQVNGRRFDCMFPERVVGNAWINVDGVAVRYAEFWQLRMVNGSATGKGHSGALLCRSAGGEVVACGLVFGGVAPNFVFAFPFNKIWRIINPD